MSRAVFLVAAALVAAPTAGSAVSARAALRIADNAPLMLIGTSFRSAETVTVRVGLGDRVVTKRAVASAAGRFVVRFSRVAVTDPCSQRPWITATGDRGSRASVKFPVAQCPPPID